MKHGLLIAASLLVACESAKFGGAKSDPAKKPGDANAVPTAKADTQTPTATTTPSEADTARNKGAADAADGATPNQSDTSKNDGGGGKDGDDEGAVLGKTATPTSDAGTTPPADATKGTLGDASQAAGGNTGTGDLARNAAIKDALGAIVGRPTNGIETEDGLLEGTGSKTPLALDLDYDGRIAFTAPAHRVQFDVDADGHAERIAWIAPTDALLALDVDGDGRITSGRELFGSATAVDGFRALAQHDANRDGVIDARDPVFARLLLWRDRDGDARGTAAELTSASAIVRSIALAPTRLPADAAPAWVGLFAQWTDVDGHTHLIGDVFFRTERLARGN